MLLIGKTYNESLSWITRRCQNILKNIFTTARKRLFFHRKSNQWAENEVSKHVTRKWKEKSYERFSGKDKNSERIFDWCICVAPISCVSLRVPLVICFQLIMFDRFNHPREARIAIKQTSRSDNAKKKGALLWRCFTTRKNHASHWLEETWMKFWVVGASVNDDTKGKAWDDLEGY